MPTMPTTPGATPTRPTMPTTPGATPTRPTMPTTPGATPSMPTMPMAPTTPTTGSQPTNSTPSGPAIPVMRTFPKTQEYTNRNKVMDDDYSRFITSPYPSGNKMYMPDREMYNYRVPMGVPMMPLYGYDNCDDSDKDWDYMKQMYPSAARKILKEIEDECDKLEYDGSCMFDEYPDRVYIGRIADRVYDKVKYLDDEMLYAESITSPKDSEDPTDTVESNQYGPEGRYDDYDHDRRYDRRHDRRHDRHHDRHDNWLRNLIEVILFNELLNRRRRFRSRRRWF
jgi:hypothetical protein